MAETNWDDVGRSFAELGRKLQGAWEEARAGDAAEDLKDTSDKVKALLDDVSATVQRVTASPEIHEAAKHAGVSVADALATSLHQVADLISSSAKRSTSSTEDARPEDAAPHGNGAREIQSSSSD